MLITNEILVDQICATCEKYLSYGPIINTTSEGIKCGRCLKDTNGGVPSLLNNMFKNVVFPCVNRFDGCKELLKIEDVPQHENVCKGSLHSCPICVNHSNNQLVEYSLLSLIHHYRIFHSKYYLTKPMVSFSTNSAKESYFLCCNEYKNILAFINVKNIAGRPYVKIVALGNNKNKIVCSLNYHNIIGTQCSSSARIGESYFELLSATKSDHSLDKMCLELEFSLLSITTSSTSLEESNVKSSSVIETKVKPEDFKYSGRPYVDFMLKCMPDFCPDSHYVNNFRKFKKNTIYGKIYVLQDHIRINYDIMCSFCENYFMLTGTFFLYDLKHTKIKICTNCDNTWYLNFKSRYGWYQSDSIKPRRSRFGPFRVYNRFKQQNDSIFSRLSLISFYCRYQCGTTIKVIEGSELFNHEKTCSNNREAALSDSEFAKIYFGDYFLDSSNEFKSTVIRNDNRIVFEPKVFGLHGRIYMVTDSGFCCIIFYKSDESNIHFSVAHKYPVDKYYILFKIARYQNFNQSFQEAKGSFKISIETKIIFFIVAPRECTEFL